MIVLYGLDVKHTARVPGELTTDTGARLFGPPATADGGGSGSAGGGGAAAEDPVDRVAVVVDRSLIHVTVATYGGQYRLQMTLPGEVTSPAVVEYKDSENKLLIKLTKEKSAHGHWPTAGDVLAERHDAAKASSRSPAPCTLVAVRCLTHNSAVYSLLPPDATDGSWECKLGQHIQVGCSHIFRCLRVFLQ